MTESGVGDDNDLGKRSRNRNLLAFVLATLRGRKWTLRKVNNLLKLSVVEHDRTEAGGHGLTSTFRTRHWECVSSI